VRAQVVGELRPEGRGKKKKPPILLLLCCPEPRFSCCIGVNVTPLLPLLPSSSEISSVPSFLPSLVSFVSWICHGEGLREEERGEFEFLFLFRFPVLVVLALLFFWGRIWDCPVRFDLRRFSFFSLGRVPRMK
jgi:hypothetical protein